MSKRLEHKLSNPAESDIKQSVSNINRKLFSIFRHHIGHDNAISSIDLFKKIYGKYPDEVDIFKRAYLWNVIKIILTKLRGNEELFVVNDHFNYYVLQTKDEANLFKDRCNRMIKAYKDMKNKANRWIRHKKWRNI